MTCANRVLPAYMGDPRAIVPENLADTALQVQVDSTARALYVHFKSMHSTLGSSA